MAETLGILSAVEDKTKNMNRIKTPVVSDINKKPTIANMRKMHVSKKSVKACGFRSISSSRYRDK
jgi:hypothetical protein